MVGVARALRRGRSRYCPSFESSGYVRFVAFQTVLYMLLALGLNVVVGWGGLLDLGFVAFYGIGAYSYAFLGLGPVRRPPADDRLRAADRRDRRRRRALARTPVPPALTGDYLAIVTLFFLQLFQTLTTNGDNVFGHNITGGPFGSAERRPVQLLRPPADDPAPGRLRRLLPLRRSRVLRVVFVALRFVNRSRTGRAWRSQREDPLAAEAMGMPVSWLKLLSFAFGAAVARFTGTLFAAQSASVFPLAFYFVLLITVYTMVILGGSGSQAGVVLGAVIIGPLLELLRDPGKSRMLFFLALVGGLLPGVPPVAARSGSSRARRCSSDSRCTRSPVRSTRSWVAGENAGGFRGVIDHWVVAPEQLARWIAPVSVHRRDRRRAAPDRRPAAGCASSCSPPTLYLAAFVWENVMLAKPEPARYIVLGLILIGLMILRPNGLLGERRVEIV